MEVAGASSRRETATSSGSASLSACGALRRRPAQCSTLDDLPGRVDAGVRPPGDRQPSHAGKTASSPARTSPSTVRSAGLCGPAAEVRAVVREGQLQRRRGHDALVTDAPVASRRSAIRRRGRGRRRRGRLRREPTSTRLGATSRPDRAVDMHLPTWGQRFVRRRAARPISASASTVDRCNRRRRRDQAEEERRHSNGEVT